MPSRYWLHLDGSAVLAWYSQMVTHAMIISQCHGCQKVQDVM
ncbi:hypothetical protein FORC81_p418 (plasmid) [Escherichia coli]|nr:hypothetical protein FORC81_p418 [Escherichia coli]